MATCKDCFNWRICQGDALYYSAGAEHCSSWLDPNNIVNVVRCKDCKWYERDTDYAVDVTTGKRDFSKIVEKPYGECQGQNLHFTEDGFLRVGDNDFCSYGERREGE